MKINVVQFTLALPQRVPRNNGQSKIFRPKNRNKAQPQHSFQAFHESLTSAMTSIEPLLPKMLQSQKKNTKMPQQQSQGLDISRMQHLSAYQIYKLNQKYYHQLKNMQFLTGRHSQNKPRHATINVCNLQAPAREYASAGRLSKMSVRYKHNTIETSKLEHQSDREEKQRLNSITVRQHTASIISKKCAARKTVFCQKDYQRIRHKSHIDTYLKDSFEQ